jgi:hypothetical protein
VASAAFRVRINYSLKSVNQLGDRAIAGMAASDLCTEFSPRRPTPPARPTTRRRPILPVTLIG